MVDSFNAIMVVFPTMSTQIKPRKREAKTISIELSVEDQQLIDLIQKEFGLNKYTDCLRLSLRETVKRIETLRTVAA